MNTLVERQQFSERLKQCLLNAHYSPTSPTELAREFNLRFDGKPITVHAARKWLIGEAIPTQDKMRALANLLGVSAEWLRFDGAGGLDTAPVEIIVPDVAPHSSESLKMIADLELLDEGSRGVVRELIRVLLRTNNRNR